MGDRVKATPTRALTKTASGGTGKATTANLAGGTVGSGKPPRGLVGKVAAAAQVSPDPPAAPIFSARRLCESSQRLPNCLRHGPALSPAEGSNSEP